MNHVWTKSMRGLISINILNNGDQHQLLNENSYPHIMYYVGNVDHDTIIKTICDRERGFGDEIENACLRYDKYNTSYIAYIAVVTEDTEGSEDQYIKDIVQTDELYSFNELLAYKFIQQMLYDFSDVKTIVDEDEWYNIYKSKTGLTDQTIYRYITKLIGDLSFPDYQKTILLNKLNQLTNIK